MMIFIYFRNKKNEKEKQIYLEEITNLITSKTKNRKFLIVQQEVIRKFRQPTDYDYDYDNVFDD